MVHGCEEPNDDGGDDKAEMRGGESGERNNIGALLGRMRTLTLNREREERLSKNESTYGKHRIITVSVTQRETREK